MYRNTIASSVEEELIKAEVGRYIRGLMGRKPCCEKVGLRRGSWTAEEDVKLINFMRTHQHAHCCWRVVPELAGLLRCGKSCRLRWTNYLRPDLRRGLFSESEEKLIIHLHAKLGNRWSKIASHLPGRTDNEIKNIWNTHIKKKLRKMGVDPLTHELVAAARSSADHRLDKDDPAAQQPAYSDSMHRARAVDDDKEAEKDPPPAPSSLDSDYCPEFCVEEVPIIQPHEILIPIWESSSSSSSSSSWDCASLHSLACSSPGSSAKTGRQTHDELPCMEMQQEPVWF